jgi:hypothetical protein
LTETNPLETIMTEALNTAEIRELTLDEIDETSGAGFLSWITRLFGGDDPQPSRGPHHHPAGK